MNKSTAAASGLASCHMCLKLTKNTRSKCPCCGCSLHSRKHDSVQRTLALLVTAVILYIPANLLPIMTTENLGNATESTILGGVVLLIKLGSVPIALIIFIASIMVPLSKMLVMFYLCWSVSHAPPDNARQKTMLFRITEIVGRWSMIDVFVVAILVALVHLEGILTIAPGTAAFAFTGVVMVTMIAAESFDPRLIWDRLDNYND